MEWSKVTQFWRAIYITQVSLPRCTIITRLLLENSVVTAWLTSQANDGGRLFAPEPACPSQDRIYQQGTLQQGPGHSYYPTQLKCSECRLCNHYTAETTSLMRPFQNLKIETFWTESKMNLSGNRIILVAVCVSVRSKKFAEITAEPDTLCGGKGTNQSLFIRYAAHWVCLLQYRLCNISISVWL